MVIYNKTNCELEDSEMNTFEIEDFIAKTPLALSEQVSFFMTDENVVRMKILLQCFNPWLG